jgi:hypothetical protein
VAAVAAAGATHLGACALRLRDTARQRYLPWVAEEFPELAARYRTSYAAGHQPSARYRDGLRRAIGRLCAEHGLPFAEWRDASEPVAARESRPAAALVRAVQLALPL